MLDRGTRTANFTSPTRCTKYFIRVKKRVWENLAKSHAYNPIRYSRRDPLRDSLARKVWPKVSTRFSDRIVCMTLGETLWDSFFYAGSYFPLLLRIFAKIPVHTKKKLSFQSTITSLLKSTNLYRSMKARHPSFEHTIHSVRWTHDHHCLKLRYSSLEIMRSEHSL